MSKKRIAVLFGGCSPEYSVSLKSAEAVISAVDKTKYEVIPIGITEQGEWFLFNGDIAKIGLDKWHDISKCVPAILSPSRAELPLLITNNGCLDRIALDAIFPVMHGKYGEDGSIQGLIELTGIPLVGCDTLCSALCMDKAKSHQIAKNAGIPVADSFLITHGENFTSVSDKAKHLEYPLFVKPVRAGSSYGISQISSPDELKNALALAFQYDNEVIVEKAISGFEVGCSIIGNENLLTGKVDEIELTKGFFNFDEKYTLEHSVIHVPARISPQKASEIKVMAKKLYRLLGCAGFARVDMFLDDTETIYFNEINTIPGFTEHSRFPNMLTKAGLSFEEIVSRIIELAVRT